MVCIWRIGGNPKFCVTAKSGANRVKFIMGDRRVIGCRLINNITPVGRDVKAKLSYPPLPSIWTGITQACARRSRQPFGRGSYSSPADVRSTSSWCPSWPDTAFSAGCHRWGTRIWLWSHCTAVNANIKVSHLAGFRSWMIEPPKDVLYNSRRLW